MAATIDITPANVAALLRARTKDSGGRELGEFTEETRPTLAQVGEALTLAEGVVAARVGDPREACTSAFNVAVVFEAACMIEKSYFPEQVESGRSHYDQLRAETDALLEGVRACQQGDDPTTGGDERMFAFDVYTPPGAGDPAVWPPEWWQRDLENPMPT